MNTAPVGGKFYIYSTKAGKDDGPNAHIVAASDANIDAFLALLPDKGIVLTEKPTQTSPQFDNSDKWATWMTTWGANAILSLTFDNVTTLVIQSFSFQLKTPWDLVFSSSEEALTFTYGLDTATNKSRVPKPGMMAEGTPVYFGLDPQKTSSNPTSTVGDLFKYAGSDKLAAALPQGLQTQAATLKLGDAGEKRNSLWFYPDKSFKTWMRLRFVLDGIQPIDDIIKEPLKGLAIQEAAIVVKTSFAVDSTKPQPQAAKTSQVYFEVDGSVTVNNETAYLLVGMDVFATGYYLTMQITSDPKQTADPFTVLVAWLASLLPGDTDLDSIKETLLKENFFTDHIHLRRLRVDVDTTHGPARLEGVNVDVEISTGSFGQGNDKSKRVAFLVAYSWSRALGSVGSIQGQLWNGM